MWGGSFVGVQVPPLGPVGQWCDSLCVYFCFIYFFAYLVHTTPSPYLTTRSPTGNVNKSSVLVGGAWIKFKFYNYSHPSHSRTRLLHRSIRAKRFGSRSTKFSLLYYEPRCTNLVPASIEREAGGSSKGRKRSRKKLFSPATPMQAFRCTVSALRVRLPEA